MPATCQIQTAPHGSALTLTLPCKPLTHHIACFAVEMLETATMLQHAGRRSLLLLDELGRGTSTHDGHAIAFAVLHHIALKTRCRRVPAI